MWDTPYESQTQYQNLTVTCDEFLNWNNYLKLELDSETMDITIKKLNKSTDRVEREEKIGKGYADFTFHPRRKNDIPFIVELKKDELPEVALNQIREKEYVEKFRRENETKTY